MVEKLKLEGIIKYIKLKQKNILVISAVLLLLITGAGFSIFRFLNSGETAAATNNDSGVNDASVAVVGEGESLIAGDTTSNNSWPGEIISLSNLQIQPAREGTISEWYVHIGERVNAGQVVGRLSLPPQMPDSIMVLAEKRQMMAEAQTNVEALRIYTATRLSDLHKLSADTEGSNNLSLIASKKKMARTILQGSLSKAFPIFSNQSSIALLESGFGPQFLKPGFGIINFNLRNTFPDILVNLASDLKDTDIVPEKFGFLYFDTAIKLVNASAIVDETLAQADLDSLKDMLITDQSDFVDAITEIKDKEAEIDAEIAELNKELAMAEGDLIAKKVAYATMEGSISGGYSIISPTGGVVSSIMKRPGEFVEPGMAMAIVTASGKGGILVRMSLPSNIQKPKVGDLLSVVRPGFGTDIKKAQLVGVGSSLDDNGSYMADAIFTEINDWPIGSSVRILQPASSSAMLIKYSSIVWDKDGKPSVWAVSEADRIFKKDITIGRTLGTSVEVYYGLQNGDKYIDNPTPDIKEDMFLDDVIKTIVPDTSSGDGGMDMHME